MVKDIKENNTQNFIKIINLFDFLGCINSLKFLRGFLLPTGKKKKKKKTKKKKKKKKNK